MLVLIHSSAWPFLIFCYSHTLAGNVLQSIVQTLFLPFFCYSHIPAGNVLQSIVQTLFLPFFVTATFRQGMSYSLLYKPCSFHFLLQPHSGRECLTVYCTNPVPSIFLLQPHSGRECLTVYCTNPVPSIFLLQPHSGRECLTVYCTNPVPSIFCYSHIPAGNVLQSIVQTLFLPFFVTATFWQGISYSLLYKPCSFHLFQCLTHCCIGLYFPIKLRSRALIYPVRWENGRRSCTIYSMYTLQHTRVLHTLTTLHSELSHDFLDRNLKKIV